jgi:hypothetical protein
MHPDGALYGGDEAAGVAIKDQKRLVHAEHLRDSDA